jgi:hypothetical protein
VSAFRRRLQFATPFVVVVGCGGSQATDNSPQPDIPGPTWQVFRTGEDCSANEPMTGCPKGAMCNPPPPSNVECPPGMSEQSVRIVQRDDKTCAVVPPGCTSMACVTQATPCPDPIGAPRKLKGPFWTVTRAQDVCYARAEPCALTDQACAQAIECPAGADVTRIALRNGICVVAPAGCADESCIGASTDCPLPAGEDLGALKWMGQRTKDTCTVTSKGPIAGERTAAIPCPTDPKGSPTFQIDRRTRADECTYRAGTFSAVIPCPPTAKPVSP